MSIVGGVQETPLPADVVDKISIETRVALFALPDPDAGAGVSDTALSQIGHGWRAKRLQSLPHHLHCVAFDLLTKLPGKSL